MSNITIPTWMDARIQPAKFTRNGRPVSTSVETFARRLANQLRAYEGKELFSAFGKAPPIDSYVGGASRARWRFRGKISPHVTRICIVMRMALQNDDFASPQAEDAAVKFELFNSSNVLVGAFEHHYGGTDTTIKPDDTPDTWALVTGTIDVTAGAEVHGLFTELNTGRLITALVYELGPDHDTDNGYVFPNVTQGGEVYADDRARLIEFVNDTWLGGGAVVENLNCNDDGAAWVYSLSAGPKNVIDQTSTTVSAATPGLFFDGTGKALAGASGVVVEMWAYASTTDEAYVYLKDSSGAILGTVTFTGAGIPGWWSSGPFVLPASAAKYDLQAESTGGETISLWAVSIYESE